MRTSQWAVRRRSRRGDEPGEAPSPFSPSSVRPFAAPAKTLQRYTVVTPDQIAVEKNARVTTQDIERTRYKSTYRETTYTADASGADPAATRTDIEVNSGNSANTAASLPSFRVSESGRLAVPDADAQPRNFYAESGAVDRANRVFSDAGADARLKTDGHGIIVPQDPTDPEGSGTRQLKKVHAAEEVPAQAQNQAGLQIAATLSAMDCNNFVRLITGAAGTASRMAVLQAAGSKQQTEVSAEEGVEPIEKIARHMSRKNPNAPAKVKRLLADNALRPQDLEEGKTAYEQMDDSKVQSRSAGLGINEDASPEVGEAFVIRSMDTVALRGTPPPRPVRGNPGILDRGQRNRMRKGYLKVLDQLQQAEDHLEDGRSQVAANVQRMMRTWGVHYAGVVAKDGPDAVTLENYNRRTEVRWEHERIFNNLFRDFEEFRAFVSLRVMALNETPDEQTIRDFVTQAAQQGNNLRLAYQNALQDAQDSFTTGLALTQRTQGANFFFQMYGPGEQSFHAAYKGDSSNPMTLRVRESPGLVAKEARAEVQRLKTLLTGLDQAISTQTVSGVTNVLQARVQRARTDLTRFRQDLKSTQARGAVGKILQESMDLYADLRTGIRNDLINAYQRLSGIHLTNRPHDLQGLGVLVANYLNNNPAPTGWFGSAVEYTTGWRQKMVHFQTLLGGFNGLNL